MKGKAPSPTELLKETRSGGTCGRAQPSCAQQGQSGGAVTRPGPPWLMTQPRKTGSAGALRSRANAKGLCSRRQLGKGWQQCPTCAATPVPPCPASAGTGHRTGFTAGGKTTISSIANKRVFSSGLESQLKPAVMPLTSVSSRVRAAAGVWEGPGATTRTGWFPTLPRA